MKSTRSLLFCAVICFIIGCGGNSGGTGVGGGNGRPRMLVSDNTSGTVSVVDAQMDTVIATVSMPFPGKIVSAGGVAVIQSTAANSISIFDNASQTIRVTVPLPALPVDIAITPSGQTAWVAENNGTIQSISLTGATAGTIGATVSMAGVQRLVMGPQGLTVLAFNDTLAINFGFVNTQTSIFVPLGNAGLDHPANGAFLGDDNNFWIFDCGKECAGTQANVSGVVLNLPGGPAISLGATLSGATVGLRNGTTVYIAGSPAAGLNAGALQLFNESNSTAGSPISIADGRHNLMARASNGALYIGATGCTLGAANAQNLRQGCLTAFNTTSSAVTPVLLPATRPNGDVTALAAVPGRNVMYVVQGGKLDILDTTSNAPLTAPAFTGTVFGVAQLQP